ncbi:MAG: hypothetical protein E7597_03340 [Ruminococcaceae bacterium]|nr:hypothetical protein [Oscillospiraceae bacterium]
MSSENKENSILAIDDILAGAAKDTKAAKDVAVPDFKAAAEAEIAKDAEEKAVSAEIPAAVTEEQELINEYSGKEKTEDNMNTSRLQALLEAHSDDDRSLLEYFSKGGKRGSKQVDRIFAMMDGSVPEETTEPRLSDSVPEKKKFVQEKLFSFGDTMQIEELPLDSGEKTSFDDDFAALSEKINSGEIRIDTEDESVDQLTLGVDEDDEVLPEKTDADSEKDKKLRMVFDMMEEGEAPPEETISKEAEETIKRARSSKKAKKHRKKAKTENKANAFEYKDREQNTEIATMLNRAVALSRLKLIGVLLLTGLIFYMELANGESARNPYLKPGRFGAVYILTDLQLLFFIVMIMSESFINGIRAFKNMRLTSDSVMAASILAASAFCVVSLLVNPTDPELKLYCLAAAASALAAATVKYMQCKKDLGSFRIVGIKKPKFTAMAIGGEAGEAGEFAKHLSESSELFTVKKASFVSGFFARTTRRPKSEDIFNFLVPVTFMAAVALFMASYLTSGDSYGAYSAATLLFCAATPITAYFMISLPVIVACHHARRYNGAFVGNAIAEEYAEAAVLSFADTEAFLPHMVSVTGVKTYGDYSIDKVMTRLGMLFDYIGGPLKTVTANMLDKVPKPDSIRLIDSAADGLYVVMDGMDYYLGKRSYMRHSRMDAPVDEADDVYAKNVGTVMYMAINDTVVAKIYVKYTINPDFDTLLRSMYRAGVCVGIKTLDPNINNELLQKSIKYKKCPVAVLKGGIPEDMNGTADEVDSGIVSASTLHNFLKMFILCDRTRHATKSNCIIHIAAMAIAMFAVAFLTLTGGVAAYGSIAVVLFQLLWFAPMAALSFLL